MPTRTRVEYLYRDASNYKRWGEFIVEGKLSKEDLQPFLFDGEWFVPTEVGLPHLLDLPMTEDDHWLHEFGGFEQADEGEPKYTAPEIIGRFERANRRGWFSDLV